MSLSSSSNSSAGYSSERNESGPGDSIFLTIDPIQTRSILVDRGTTTTTTRQRNHPLTSGFSLTQGGNSIFLEVAPEASPPGGGGGEVEEENEEEEEEKGGHLTPKATLSAMGVSIRPPYLSCLFPLVAAMKAWVAQQALGYLTKRGGGDDGNMMGILIAPYQAKATELGQIAKRLVGGLEAELEGNQVRETGSGSGSGTRKDEGLAWLLSRTPRKEITVVLEQIHQDEEQICREALISWQQTLEAMGQDLLQALEDCCQKMDQARNRLEGLLLTIGPPPGSMGASMQQTLQKVTQIHNQIYRDLQQKLPAGLVPAPTPLEADPFYEKALLALAVTTSAPNDPSLDLMGRYQRALRQINPLVPPSVEQRQELEALKEASNRMLLTSSSTQAVNKVGEPQSNLLQIKEELLAATREQLRQHAFILQLSSLEANGGEVNLRLLRFQLLQGIVDRYVQETKDLQRLLERQTEVCFFRAEEQMEVARQLLLASKQKGREHLHRVLLAYSAYITSYMPQIQAYLMAEDQRLEKELFLKQLGLLKQTSLPFCTQMHKMAKNLLL